MNKVVKLNVEVYQENEHCFYVKVYRDGKLLHKEIHKDEFLKLDNWTKSNFGFILPSYNNLHFLHKAEDGTPYASYLLEHCNFEEFEKNICSD